MRNIVLVLLACFSVACGGEGATGASTVLGNYKLRRINGSSLPVTITASNGTKTEYIDDAIAIHEGGTYDWVGHSRVTVNGQTIDVTTTQTGTYGLQATSVFLTNNAGGTTVAQWEGGVMTIAADGRTGVYTK
jgi:hypothetical protein